MLILSRESLADLSSAPRTAFSHAAAERRSCKGSGLDPHFDHVPQDEPLRSDKPFQGV